MVLVVRHYNTHQPVTLQANNVCVHVSCTRWQQAQEAVQPCRSHAEWLLAPLCYGTAWWQLLQGLQCNTPVLYHRHCTAQYVASAAADFRLTAGLQMGPSSAIRCCLQAGHKQMKSQVELGSGVFCRAVVPDTSHICISIGLGFHLEVTLEEAGRVIDLKQEALREQVERCIDKAARIKAHLKFVAEAIRELTELPAA